MLAGFPFLSNHLQILLNSQLNPSMSSLRILVAGATGKQGGALIRALLSTKHNFTIYGLTRSLTSASALKLKSSGINIITGNMDKPSAIFAQLPRNLDAVFSVQVPGGSG